MMVADTLAEREPGVLEAFEKIWNTNELIVSYDTINLTLPNASKMAGSKPWPHVDQAPERQGLSCVQGIINRMPNLFSWIRLSQTANVIFSL
jgi:hypothetical protein